MANTDKFNEADEDPITWVQLVRKCFNVLDIFIELWKKSKLDWSTRLDLAACIQEFLKLELEQDENLVSKHNEVSNHFLQMINDPDYRVRLAMSRGIILLFLLFTEHVSIYEDVKNFLSPLLKGKLYWLARNRVLVLKGSANDRLFWLFNITT